VLLKGAGKAFCAGIDVNELAGESALDYREWIERMERPLVAISRMKKPIIAQLHGVAAANGMGLVASADLVIAADNARMGLTAINVGLNCIGPVIPVASCVGRKKALGAAALRQLDPGRRSPRSGPGQQTGAQGRVGDAGPPVGGGTGPKKPHSGPDRQKRFLQRRGHGVCEAVRVHERGIRSIVHGR
jgi:hypothetical protein